MSMHWRPDEMAAPLTSHQTCELQSEWTRASSYLRQAAREPLPSGAKAGLVLLGLLCLALAAGMYQAFGPLEPVAAEAAMLGQIGR